MCGRYRLKDPRQAFAWLEVAPTSDFLPRFNIAPTQRIPVLPASGRIEPMTWGILPAGSSEKSRPLINARSETIRTRRSFKSAFTQRRCLLPADGFYEWSRLGKQPHLLTLRGGVPFVIAAIWEPGPDSPRCCLLTTSANSLLQPIHSRMPVIVRREDWPQWLSPSDLPAQAFQRITTPYAPDEMSALPVSPLLNSASVDDPRCCEPPGPLPLKPSPTPDSQQTFAF